MAISPTAALAAHLELFSPKLKLTEDELIGRGLATAFDFHVGLCSVVMTGLCRSDHLRAKLGRRRDFYRETSSTYGSPNCTRT
jgi:hypothetical protein